MSTPARSVFFGTPDFAVPIAEATAEVTELVAVVTQPDRPRGRGREVSPPPVKRWALERGLPIFQPTRLRDGSLAEALEELRPDVAIVAAYGRILPKELLELPRLGCLNVHASILPKYRGAAPIQWAIAQGEEVTGVSLMQMDEGLDTGDVLAVRTIPIEAEDTGGSIHDKLARLGKELIREELPRFLAAELEPSPQDESQASLARILEKEDGRLDFHQRAEVLERRIRAFDPWPGTFTYLGPDQKGLLKIHRAAVASLAEDQREAEPGTVISLQPVLVAAGEGTALELVEIQPEGRRRMSAAEAVAGRRIQARMRLDPDRPSEP